MIPGLGTAFLYKSKEGFHQVKVVESRKAKVKGLYQPEFDGYPTLLESFDVDGRVSIISTTSDAGLPSEPGLAWNVEVNGTWVPSTVQASVPGDQQSYRSNGMFGSTVIWAFDAAQVTPAPNLCAHPQPPCLCVVITRCCSRDAATNSSIH